MVPNLYRCFASSRRRGLPCEFRFRDSELQLGSGNVLFGGQAEIEKPLLAVLRIAGVFGAAPFLHARPFEFFRFQASVPSIFPGDGAEDVQRTLKFPAIQVRG